MAAEDVVGPLPLDYLPQTEDEPPMKKKRKSRLNRLSY